MVLVLGQLHWRCKCVSSSDSATALTFSWQLRIGPYPIIGAELNPQRLAQEIRNAIGNEEFKRHGKALSEKLRKENGVNRLLDEIERKIRPVQRL